MRTSIAARCGGASATARKQTRSSVWLETFSTISSRAFFCVCAGTGVATRAPFCMLLKCFCASSKHASASIAPENARTLLPVL